MTRTATLYSNLSDELIRSLDTPLFVLDAGKHVYFMNHAAEEMTGWSGHRARGIVISDILRTDEQSLLSSHAVQGNISAREPGWHETVCHLGDGSKTVMMRQRNLNLPDGRPGMLLTVQDAALRKERYEHIFSSSPLIFVEADDLGRIIYGSRQLAEVLGRQQQQFCGKAVVELVASGQQQIFESIWARVLQGETARIRDISLIHSDGEPRHFWLYLFPFLNTQGQVTGVCVLAGDLAEQKGLAYALEAAEERFSVLFRQSSDPIIIFSMRGEVLTVNPAFERISGLRSDALFAGKQNWEEVIYEQDRPRVRQTIRRVVSEERETVVEFRMKTDQGLVWFEQSCSILHDEKGRARGMMAVARDISRLKEREMKLREETKVIQRRHQRAQELIGRLTCFLTRIADLPTDINGYLKGVSDLLYEMYDPLLVVVALKNGGYVSWRAADSLKQILEKDSPILQELPHAAFMKHDGPLYCKQLDTTEPYADDTLVRQLKLKTCLGAPLRDSSGTLHGFLAILDQEERDFDHLDIEVITVAALQMASRLKTSELDDAQQDLQEHLRQSKKMEAVGMLAGGIAHDFNNILSGILGFSSYLLSKVDPESEIHRQIGLIEQSAMRAADLTRQLLAFSRRTNFSKETVAMNQVIEETLGILEHSIPKNITIEKDLDLDLPPVLGDRGQLNQVIMNLCLNAVEAMAAGPGRLSVNTECRPLTERERSVLLEKDESDFVCITLQDTGRGIDAKIMEHIFDPFFTTKEKSGGSGLGLSIVYGIISNHGGDICVESELDRGSTFRIYLPACTEAQPRKNGKISRKPVGGTETVMVVDDEAIVRQMVSDIIKDHGYTAVCAGSGEQAVNMLQEHNGNIDLVLLDMVMPGMDGAETFYALRETHPRVRVLLTTGFAEGDRCAALIKQGALGLVRKPYKSQDLLYQIRRVLDKIQTGTV
jgi:PAS domain S-box-containing protein